MCNLHCYSCDALIDYNQDVFVFDDKIFDTEDCIIEYIKNRHMVDEVRLIELDKGE